jgi:5-methylthioribose kinase
MGDTVQKSCTLQKIFHESIGFAGMEMLRRIIGAAHVKDIESIAEVQRKLQVETAILKFGSALVKQHQNIATINALIASL